MKSVGLTAKPLLLMPVTRRTLNVLPKQWALLVALAGS